MSLDATIRRGDCFEVAAKIVISPEFPKCTLVHGLPVGQGPENFGLRYWHAWVEVNTHGVITVLDLANNRRIVKPRDEYYEAGHIKNVWRYNKHQAFAQIKKHETWGPWVKDWEKMG